MVSAVIPFQISIGGRSSAGYGLRATGAGREVETRLQLPALPSDPSALGLALGQALFPVPVRQLLIELAHEADEADARLQIQLSWCHLSWPCCRGNGRLSVGQPRGRRRCVMIMRWCVWGVALRALAQR